MYSEYAIITSRLGFKSVAVGSRPMSAADFEIKFFVVNFKSK